tara:strand:- start:1793 stop:2497 length:705 start_codon:yes stop_codon:yes gene_type:complete
VISLFNKKPKIHLDCFCTEETLFELFPLKYAKDVIPSWFKKIPSSKQIDETFPSLNFKTSFKHCNGIIDLYKEGFVIPLWTDFLIDTTNDGEIYFDMKASLEKGLTHWDPDNVWKANSDYYTMHKLESPWWIKSKQSCKMLFTNTFWNTRFPQLQAVNGVIDYKYARSTNINFTLRKEPFRVLIEAGTPLVHIVPLTDAKVVLHQHIATEKDSLMYVPFFKNPIAKLKKLKNKR